MPQIRGFDGAGGALFFNLDQTAVYATAASLAISPRGKFEAGITAELFSFRNTASGRLDPFLFSNMSLFMPDKYKIDSLVSAYASYGIFGRKTLRPRPWWHCDGLVSVSRIKLQAYANTREFDFSNLIPRLIDLQRSDFLDEDYILGIIRIGNEISFRKATVTVAIQQAIPVNLKSGNAGNINAAPSEGSVKRSIRGGTRYCIGVVYDL